MVKINLEIEMHKLYMIIIMLAIMTNIQTTLFFMLNQNQKQRQNQFFNGQESTQRLYHVTNMHDSNSKLFKINLLNLGGILRVNISFLLKLYQFNDIFISNYLADFKYINFTKIAADIDNLQNIKFKNNEPSIQKKILTKQSLTYLSRNIKLEKGKKSQKNMKRINFRQESKVFISNVQIE
ncbi:hypothetical protein ABPG72_010686 [Tetrahymena utriculariae]